MAAGAALYIHLDSAAAAAACLAAGVLIDIDHVPDYCINTGIKTARVSDFFSACRGTRLSRLYLVLHSYELLFLFMLAGLARGWNAITLGAGAGWLLHMVLDQAGNRIRGGIGPLFYFITYRASKRFRKELLTRGRDAPARKTL